MEAGIDGVGAGCWMNAGCCEVSGCCWMNADSWFWKKYAKSCRIRDLEYFHFAERRVFELFAKSKLKKFWSKFILAERR